jgi:hypothetical protein
MYVTQVRRASSDYTSLIYNNLIVFEFFMPLTNEGHLRTSLDALFYEDTLIAGLKAIDRTTIETRIPMKDEENEADYYKRICEWVSQRFGGYSISHVQGRFRAEDLSSFEVAAKLQEAGSRYLIDETTAVVRFIFHCGSPIKKAPPLSVEHFEDDVDSEIDEAQIKNAENDAAVIRWFFGVLFVQSIVQVVNGEDEIWMMESGMRKRLHIWRVERRSNVIA